MLRRVDLYHLIGGDVFVEESPFSHDYRTYQVVGRHGKHVMARDLETGYLVRFFYYHSIYAPKLFLRTRVVRD